MLANLSHLATVYTARASTASRQVTLPISNILVSLPFLRDRFRRILSLSLLMIPMFYVSDINGIQTIHTGSVALRSTDTVLMVSDLAEAARLEAANSASDTDVVSAQGTRIASTNTNSSTQAAASEDAVIIDSPLATTTTTNTATSSATAPGFGDPSSGIAMVSSAFVPNTGGAEGRTTANEAVSPRGGDNPYYQVTPVENIAPSSTADLELPHEHVPPPHDPYRQLNQPPTQRQRAIRAAQIMSSPVVTLLSTDFVQTAWELFHQRRFRHLPIVSAAGRLVGVLSDRDFLSLGLDHIGRELSRSEQLHRPLSEIMRTNVLTCRPQTEIRAICQVMFAERIGAMPVVDEAGELVGILTGHDILKTLVNRAPLEMWT